MCVFIILTNVDRFSCYHVLFDFLCSAQLVLTMFLSSWQIMSCLIFSGTIGIWQNGLPDKTFWQKWTDFSFSSETCLIWQTYLFLSSWKNIWQKWIDFSLSLCFFSVLHNWYLTKLYIIVFLRKHFNRSG